MGELLQAIAGVGCCNNNTQPSQQQQQQQQQQIMTINMDYQGNRRIPVMLAILVVEMVVAAMKCIGVRPRK